MSVQQVVYLDAMMVISSNDLTYLVPAVVLAGAAVHAAMLFAAQAPTMSGKDCVWLLAYLFAVWHGTWIFE